MYHRSKLHIKSHLNQNVYHRSKLHIKSHLNQNVYHTAKWHIKSHLATRLADVVVRRVELETSGAIVVQDQNGGETGVCELHFDILQILALPGR